MLFFKNYSCWIDVFLKVYVKVHIYINKPTHLFKNTLCVNRIHVSHICIQWNLPRTSSHLGENPLENFLTRGFVTFFMLHVFWYRLVNILWSHLNSKSMMILEFLKTLLICKAFYTSNAGHTKGILWRK